MPGKFVLASAIAVVATAAILTGSGLGSSGAAVLDTRGIPAGLADAIHARFGAGPITPGLASRATTEGPYFGWSVALSADGTTALVGAPGVGGNRGAAYVFHASDAGSWSSAATPTA